MVMLVAAFVVPYFAATINTSRMYAIALILLSPFGISGANWIFGRGFRLFLRRDPHHEIASIHFLAVFFAAYLLLNTGVIHQLAGEPTSFALDPLAVQRPTFNATDIAGSRWIAAETLPNSTIFGDAYYVYAVVMATGSYNSIRGSTDVSTEFGTCSLILLGSANLQNAIVRLDSPRAPRISYTSVPIANTSLPSYLKTTSRVYDAGPTEIRFTRCP